jgi:hypothetical protein
MADNKQNQTKKQLEDLSKKSSMAVFGTGKELEKESEKLKDVIKQTMVATSEKYGNRANGKVVNYFNEINFTSAFAEFKQQTNDKEKSKEFRENPDRAFKKYMAEQDFAAVSAIITSESGRIIAYNNYKAIYTHIPEAAQALDTYKDNIMSPDDFTKLIFNIEYDHELDDEIKEKVEGQLDDLRDKYEIEDLADEVIGESLMYGDQFISVLSLEKELDNMLTDPVMDGLKNLNEGTMKFSDLNVIDIEVNKTDVERSSSLNEAISELLHLKEDEKNRVTDDVSAQLISEIINKNVHIGSKREFLLERVSAEKDRLQSEQLTDIPEEKTSGKKKTKKKEDNKPMYINGSSIKVLDPSRVIELKIDNVIYGYYYVQDFNMGNIPNAGYLGASTGREVLNPVNMGSNIITTNNSKFTPSTNSMSVQGISDAKVNIISKVFLDVLSKKINKDFVRHNKEFKDFIFNLVKQDYILKKEIKLIYFTPDEIVAFKVPPLYRKIVFFAKLYLAMLTNILLIKMGRGHDKRVFYIDVGADANYEQAISRVIQDIKTKEFKMENMGEINTILNLSPGRFDDYYIPMINGEEPIKIETLQGMDVDMTNDFLEFLKDSMMSGIGIPRTLIDATKEIDFARTLSAQNANFVRNVIKYQKKFTPPFTKLFRKLYENEYKYTNDQESDILSLIDLKDIKVSFPSPATLNMSNLTDQIQTVEGNAEFISSQLITPDPTGMNDGKRLKLKAEIIKDLLPGVDWEKYEEMRDNLEVDFVEDEIKNPPMQTDEFGNPII